MIARIALCAALAAGQAAAADLDVRVTGVRNARGSVRVAICDAATFPSDRCPFHAEAAARDGTVTLRVAAVPPGSYAAAAYHDEAGIGRLEFTFFGAPKQGVGFSHDARMQYGPPHFSDAAFRLTERGLTVTIALHYRE